LPVILPLNGAFNPAGTIAATISAGFLRAGRGVALIDGKHIQKLLCQRESFKLGGYWKLTTLLSR